jgi:hypothetical protein
VAEDLRRITRDHHAPKPSCANTTSTYPSHTATSGTARPVNAERNIRAALGKRNAVVETGRCQEGAVTAAEYARTDKGTAPAVVVCSVDEQDLAIGVDHGDVDRWESVRVVLEVDPAGHRG